MGKPIEQPRQLLMGHLFRGIAKRVGSYQARRGGVHVRKGRRGHSGGNRGVGGGGRDPLKVFVGKDYSKVRNHSEETSQAIDKEVHSLITSAYKKAINILQINIDVLHNVATILLEKETLDKDEFENLAMNVHTSSIHLGKA